MSKISLEDVAKSLGVSKTLVSLVINGKADAYGISKDTRDRVLEKVKELNYQPNQAARGLRTGKSNIIGLVVADISNQFYSKISRSIENFVEKNGYHLMLSSSDEDPDREMQLIKMFRERQQVDGIIVSTTQKDPAFFKQLREENYPCVFIDRTIEGFHTDNVVVDNKKGSKKVVELLIKNGVRKIGMLTISPSYTSTIQDRITGYKDALTANDIKVDEKIIIEIPFNDVQQAVKKAVKELVSPPNNVKGIYVLNNSLAIACLEVLHDMNLRIPQDVALVSFDDIDLFRFSYPPVTAVSQPLEDIGTKAAELLMELINEKTQTSTARPKDVVLQTEIVVRSSCGSSIRDFSA